MGTGSAKRSLYDSLCPIRGADSLGVSNVLYWMLLVLVSMLCVSSGEEYKKKEGLLRM